jgi:NitT/TauT family transport system ATP-binding protein
VSGISVASAAAAGTTAASDHFVVCDHIGKTFSHDGETMIAISDATLEARPGEFVSLLGPSGCGKSTLLRIINGLERPTLGTASVAGKPVTGPRPEIGFVFQADSLLPWRTIEDNVIVGLELRGVRRREARTRAREYLELTGLEHFARRFPYQLSGGMRQRANLARALIIDPELLLMDEPFGALDAQTRELMQTELLRIWEQHKKTVLFVTHSIEEAVYLSDRILLMSARPGRIVHEYRVVLERPRDPEVRHTVEFLELTKQIWERLRGEVMATFRKEAEEEVHE